jgi:hypothetical protein
MADLKLCSDTYGDEISATNDEIKTWIASQLATTFSDDREFLRKINKLTFGLISTQ